MKKTRRLNERQEVEISPEQSLDAQVLAFLTRAERSAVSDAKIREPLEVAEAVNRKNVKFIFEAEEDDEDNERKINIETFASEVVRLIQNSENLLDIQNTIVKMSKNYIKNSYSEDYAEELEEILKSEYSVGGTSEDDNKKVQRLGVGAKASSV